MALLLDLFGFLSVVLRGLTLTAQSLTVGGIAFLLLLARPLAGEIGVAGVVVIKRSRTLLGWSAIALALVAAVSVFIEGAILADTVGLTASETLGAAFVLSGVAVVVASVVIAWLALHDRSGDFSGGGLLALAAVILIAQTMTSHAVAQIDGRLLLAAADLLHQAGAAVWIGGIPYLLIALKQCPEPVTWRRVGKRFSHIAMVSVAVIVVAGLIMAIAYTGSVAAVYGTTYGVMVLTKVALLFYLLLLGGMNYLLVERLAGNPATPMLRLRRFAEAEIGIGITLFFAAASLTSLPPAVDLPNEQVSVAEIAERMMPTWPRLSSPDHADLAIPALQAKLDAEAQAHSHKAEAFVPGAGELPPRNAKDIAWSEYNHHWSGLVVLVIGLLALAERSGRAPWARNWPLLFLFLAGFLFLRSDPETWPLGEIGLLDSLRDPEVVQHRLFVLLIVGFGITEWRVRTGRSSSDKSALVFPLVTALGGALLLAHSHAVINAKEQLLIELSHVPLALFGVAAGWARWLELRLDPPAGRIAAWVWPVCLVLVGLVLLNYREA
jgi:putative copper resistance protein D